MMLRFVMVAVAILGMSPWGEPCIAIASDTPRMVQTLDCERQECTWEVKCGITEETETGDKWEGNTSDRFYGTQDGKWHFASISSHRILLAPGRRYVLSGWVKLTHVTRKEYAPFLALAIRKGDNELISTVRTSRYEVIRENSWQELEVEFESPKGAAFGDVLLGKGTQEAVTADILVDSIRVAELTETKPGNIEEKPRWYEKWKEYSSLRPRLLLNRQRDSYLRRAINKEPYASLWRSVKERTDRLLKKIPSIQEVEAYSPVKARSLGDAIPYLAFAYLLTNDSKYRDATRKYMCALTEAKQWPGEEDLSGAHMVIGMALGYDWLYEEFTSTERKRFERKIETQAGVLYNLLVSHEIWWATAYLQNHNYVCSTAVGLAGLALPGGSSVAVRYIKAAERNFKKVCHYLSPDGASHEGVGYWTYGTRALLMYMKAAEPLLGSDMFHSSAFFKNTARFRLYSSLPGFRESANFADSHRIEFYHPGPVLRFLASAFKDGYAQWLAQKIEEVRGGLSRISWLDLVWYDDSVHPLPPDELPTYAYFENLGLLFCRSDWSNRATWAFFKAGPPVGRLAEDAGLSLASHVHPDEGNFLLWGGGQWLVVDDGWAATKLTENHSILLFQKVGQIGEGKKAFDDTDLRAHRTTARITFAEMKPQTQYVEADLTKIYPPEALLKRYKRTFIFIRPNWVVIKDDVEMFQSGQVDSLVHVVGEMMDINKGHIVVTAGGVGLGLWVHSDVPFSFSSRNNRIHKMYDYLGMSYSDRKLMRIAFNNVKIFSCVYAFKVSSSELISNEGVVVQNDEAGLLNLFDGGNDFVVDFSNRSVRGGGQGKRKPDVYRCVGLLRSER